PQQRSISFMMLGDINYGLGNYLDAKNYYDSTEPSSLNEEIAKQRYNNRTPGLAIIAEQAKIIQDEDSLQQLAAMPKAQRDAAVKKMVRSLRKQQGLKEEPDEEINVNPAVQQKPVELFNSTASASDWYFNNLALKTQGFQQFRSKWGNRPNADNWRRLAAIQEAKKNEEEENAGDSTDAGNDGDEKNNINVKLQNPGEEGDENSGEINFDNLYKNIPLTDEQMAASNKKIADAIFTTGEAFQNKLEEYDPAIENYEKLLNKFPATDRKEEALFNLYYCYNKLGRKFSADSASAALKQNYPDGKIAAKLNGKPEIKNAADPATKKYEDIYNLFIEGKFDEAKNEKAKADSMYGSNFWTPQLLYIESIYYVSKREDSIAIEKLTQLAEMDPKSPLSAKATTMIDVLNRRPEIENYLTNLQITRKEDDPLQIATLTKDETTVQKPDITKRDSSSTKPIQRDLKNVDTAKNVIVEGKAFVFNASEPQYAVIILDKVDAVYASETRNAFNKYNSTTFYSQRIASSSV
ncbi:MAG TPA: hypothetical protein PL045_12700, partial [Chitinophagaceae bacterium]|nr:hypothetical protein [Chitinophagaceae bacterium]